MTIYYAILTYNRSESLLNLLQSIEEQILPSDTTVRIIIWDNASSKEHRQRFLNSEFHRKNQINYLYNEFNSFMVGKLHLEKYILANYELSEEDFIAHLDDDVQLEKHWTFYTLNTCLSNNWAACGSVENWKGVLIYSGQSTLQFEDIQLQNKTIRVWNWKWENVIDHQEEKEVVFAGHRALLVHMSAISNVQHDPYLLIGGEDLDFSLALRKRGYRIGIHPKALIYHRLLGEKDANGFRTNTKILPSWKHFHKKWGFVRKNVFSELKITLDEWLDMVVEWS